MKRGLLFALSMIGLLMLLTPACQKKENQAADRYSFWQGEIENQYYILDMHDQRLQVVKGKPYMVLEYDPVTGVPLRCEFGLSDAKNESLPGAEGVVPEPFMSASGLLYAKRLNLSGSVDLLCNWEVVSTHDELSAGGFEFYIDKGSNMWGHEVFHFSFTFDDMTGEINNESATCGGSVSELKAFKMLRKFNSNTIN